MDLPTAPLEHVVIEKNYEDDEKVFLIKVTRGSESWHILRRYSWFAEVYEKLQVQLPCEFPVKHWIATSLDQGTVTLRTNKLQQFLDLLQSEDLSTPFFFINIFNTTAFSSVCVQMGRPGNEDCLYLNVYVPIVNAPLLPVMIWIHGGGFQVGTGSDYDGSILATKGSVIIVTFNYRLNILGFFQSDLIRQSNPNYPTLGGMNGVIDQVLAITWVKNNAQRFGGDPEKITIFGESAGSVSVSYLLSAPLLPSGLFQNAIMESGAILGPWGPISSDLGLSESSDFMKKNSITTLQQLQKLDIEILSNYTPKFLWWPTLDGYFYPESPDLLFMKKINIPENGAVIIGSNSLDTLFAWPWYNGPYPSSFGDLQNLLEKYFGAKNASNIFALYSSETPPLDPTMTFQLMNRDVCVLCPMKFVAEALVRHSIPTYFFFFGFNPVNTEYRNYASHTSEVGLVFGFKLYVFAFNQSLSDSMGNYWTSFARTHVPSDSRTRLEWPEWKESKPLHMYFNEENRVESGLQEEECRLWNSLRSGSDSSEQMVNFCFQEDVYTRSN